MFPSVRAYDHSVEASISGQGWKILLYSNNNASVLLNEGEALEFTLLAGAGTDPNYYPLVLSDIIVTDLEGDNVYTSHSDGMLQVTDGVTFLTLHR